MHPGARVGIAALSGRPAERALERGLERLRALGYEPVLASNLETLAEGPSMFAGCDHDRLAGFHALAADETIEAIVFARGGHGLLRVLPEIDWELLARRPRLYMGYSDLTPFLHQVVRRLGWIAFHGPMVAPDLGREEFSELEERAFSASFEGRIGRSFELEVLARGGQERPVVGPLDGGCLSLLVASLGTPWAPCFRGSVVFLEDVGEPGYRLDRMLTQLSLSDTLDRVVGIVLGHLSAIDENSESCSPKGSGAPEASAQSGEEWRTALIEVCNGSGRVLLAGLPAGHSTPNIPLPLGAAVTLDPVAGQLEIHPPNSHFDASTLGTLMPQPL